MPDKDAKQYLFSPIKIGKCQIPNRLGLGPLNTGLVDSNGECKTGCLDFYEQYFKEDIGLVFIGGISVSPEGRSNRNSLCLDKKENCSGVKAIVEMAHDYRSKIAVQIMHAGRQTNPDEIGECIVAPSPIACPIVKKIPRELTIDEIEKITAKFITSAKLVERCGADMIELHCAHGYLISGFLSPYSNKRTDMYGGSLINRFRILEGILHEISNQSSIPIGIRISCLENVNDGLQFDELIEGLKRFVSKYIHFVSVSAGVYSPNDIIIPKRSMGNALWKSYSLIIKNEVQKHVMLTGNITSINQAETILKEGAADIVLMARTLLAEPKLLSKTKTGNVTTIQECTDCRVCKYHSYGYDRIYCPFNNILRKFHNLEKMV
jgi:2,4-dienoyl-CoA reductase-like NADH-dependent reductase (Old Yellow Enzyme family)